MKKITISITLLAAFVFITGFKTDNAIVPQEDILSGGPPKDGIPAILQPEFVRPTEAGFLKESDDVIGVRIGNEARAYPIKILNWHEVVNDTVNGVPIVVTFWPLTQTGVVYSRNVNDEKLTFGVSGRLYKSNVLLYDHQTESLWSQLKRQAISGPRAGSILQILPSGRVKWKTWQKQNRKTLVLSDNTGFLRDYSLDPYEGYYSFGGLMFPVGDVRQDMSAKERVLGIEIDKHAKAYPLNWLSTHPGILKDTIGNRSIQIEVNPDGEVVAVKDAQGKPIPATYSYWFAWQAFHRETEVFKE